MFETTATVAAILGSSTQVHSALLRMVTETRAQACQTIWSTTPMWFRVLLVASLAISVVERAYRMYRRWRRVLL
jgi:hypothetical protein